MSDIRSASAPARTRRVLRLLAAALVMAWPVLSAKAQSKIVHISATDWPPYTTPDLPAGGATTEVVRKAFETAGYEVEVVYDTWPNAIELARKGTDDVVAYYPGYHCEHRAGFVASGPIGHGPLGFAEHVEAPLVWASLDDIGERKLKIGTVRGYANTDEFDKKVGRGWIHAIPSKDDLTNLQKLLRKRLDAVVIDRFVLEYLKSTDTSLKRDADKLRFNDKPLEDKTLYLCFRGDAEGKRLLGLFDKGLEAISVDGVVDDYFAAVFSK